MTVAKGKKVVNVAPFVTGRDMIDKWIGEILYRISSSNMAHEKWRNNFLPLIFFPQITTTQIKIDIKLPPPTEKEKMKLNE